MPRVLKPKPVDQAKVPAFQRKRSLSAKGRKRPALATALQRKEAGVPVVKPKGVRKTYKRVSTKESLFGTTSISGDMSDVYERRERLKARLAEQGSSSGSSSSSSSGGGFASLSAAENRITGSLGLGTAESVGFTSPIIDDCEPNYSSSDVREMQECGVVDAFFDRVDVAAVVLTKSIRVGDKLIFETQAGLFEQELKSMQIDREDVMTAYSGDDVGIKVVLIPKRGGKVYKVI